MKFLDWVNDNASPSVNPKAWCGWDWLYLIGLCCAIAAVCIIYNVV